MNSAPRRMTKLSLLLVFCAAVCVARADSITVTNYSWEDPPLADGGQEGNWANIPGWDGGRTPISGDDRLQGNDELIDLEFSNYVGFDTDEKIRAIGWTILGRDGSTSASWRVIGRYTNGTDTGSSSTYRFIDMSSGNTSDDSFSGIIAPDGYWMTGMRVHCDTSGVWTAHDHFRFYDRSGAGDNGTARSGRFDGPENPKTQISIA